MRQSGRAIDEFDQWSASIPQATEYHFPPKHGKSSELVSRSDLYEKCSAPKDCDQIGRSILRHQLWLAVGYRYVSFLGGSLGKLPL